MCKGFETFLLIVINGFYLKSGGGLDNFINSWIQLTSASSVANTYIGQAGVGF